MTDLADLHGKIQKGPIFHEFSEQERNIIVDALQSVDGLSIFRHFLRRLQVPPNMGTVRQNTKKGSSSWNSIYGVGAEL